MLTRQVMEPTPLILIPMGMVLVMEKKAKKGLILLIQIVTMTEQTTGKKQTKVPTPTTLIPMVTVLQMEKTISRLIQTKTPIQMEMA